MQPVDIRARRRSRSAARISMSKSRRDAFNRLAARDALMVDAEPQQLGVQLVNRYHAVKRAGLI